MGINDTYFNPFNPSMDYTPPKSEGSFGWNYINEATQHAAAKPVPLVSGGTAPEVGEVIHLSNRIETSLNNRYPNGYRVVGIGRSPSLIMEVLKAKGVDAKSIPISGLTNEEWDFAKRYPWLKQLNSGDVRAFGEYLKEIGLSADNIANARKRTVFVDYTKTGNSLRGFLELIGRSEIGIRQNIDVLSINRDLFPEPTKAEREMIDRLWERQGMKLYSFMPRMEIEQLGRVKQILADFKPQECAVKFLNQVIKALKLVE